MENLTALQVKTANPGPKQYKLTDGKGLYLLVTKTGKYWRYDYRYLNKRKTLALGVYPDVSLKKARERHRDARKLLTDDIDPGHFKKVTKAARYQAAENSFGKFAWEWFAKQQWTEGHRRTVRGRLNNDIIPWLGDRPVIEITAQEVLVVCRRVENRGAIESAHRIKTICSQVFRYCVASGIVESDPCRDLAKALTPAVPKNMATITDPVRVGELMRAIEGYGGHSVTRAALQLAPLVFVRPGELRHAEWSEFDFDQAVWKIPSEKMKMRQPHLVPLSKQAVEILKDIKLLTGDRRYVFPSARTTVRPMSNNAILAALRRMGYPKEEITGHGFRGMASTLLHELGWDSKLIERQLAHSDKNTVRAAYNHAEYLPERIKMMQAWADYLDGLKAGGDVIHLKRNA
ncbi:MAG: tyrosine-type recombinase/integrase [Desulfobacteraceae bacterium]|nr:tyrosine-type recombinase/integrase [Desulfobacteraceae bacterium]